MMSKEAIFLEMDMVVQTTMPEGSSEKPRRIDDVPGVSGTPKLQGIPLNITVKVPVKILPVRNVNPSS